MIHKTHYRAAFQTFVLAVVCLFLATQFLYRPSASSPSSIDRVASVFRQASPPQLPIEPAAPRDPPAPVQPVPPTEPETSQETPQIFPDHVYSSNGGEQKIKPMTKEEKLIVASKVVPIIMNLGDKTVERLSCEAINENRYRTLKADTTSTHFNSMSPARVKYFFALDLFECARLLPTLMGSIVETMRFLGPQNCALSVVEGRSRDSTREILEGMRAEIEKLGAKFHLGYSDVNPKDGARDRIQALADLRNQALEPMVKQADLFDQDATVIFVNDVALCPDDMLELLYQENKQGADMSCAMDWLFGGGIFYDVWVARGMTGDSFFEIPQDGSWGFAERLFWNDEKTKKRLDAFKPFQVYACWNGIAVFKAKPIMDKTIKFRMSEEEECYMGEPTLLCKDFWRHGYRKIQVVPSVNVGYNAAETQKIITRFGTVKKLVEKPVIVGNKVPDEMIEWQADPPSIVKCARNWTQPSWVPPL
jgi:alpha-1,3-mannosyltransferase